MLLSLLLLLPVQVAVYKDERGEVHKFSGLCPHLGCLLQVSMNTICLWFSGYHTTFMMRLDTLCCSSTLGSVMVSPSCANASLCLYVDSSPRFRRKMVFLQKAGIWVGPAYLRVDCDSICPEGGYSMRPVAQLQLYHGAAMQLVSDSA